jgi:hypothetical protein
MVELQAHVIKALIIDIEAARSNHQLPIHIHECPSAVRRPGLRHMTVAKPFDWTYTRDDLARLLVRLTPEPNPLKIPA